MTNRFNTLIFSKDVSIKYSITMNGENIKTRTKANAIKIGHLTLMLPYSYVDKQYILQIIWSSASVAANYSAASRGKSDKDFLNKLKICEEECDETQFWLELLAEFNPSYREQIILLYKECNELIAIFVSSIKTIRKKLELQDKPSK